MTHLLDMPHHEARALARTGAPVFLFVNPVEYHGPHLSLHNDRHLSVGMAERLAAAEGWPWTVAGHVEMGVDPCPGPGTRHSSFLEVRRAVMEACRALADLGATKVVLMTFHGAPLHNLAIDAGLRWLVQQGVAALAPFHLIIRELRDLEDGEAYAGALDAADRGAPRAELARLLPRDLHAGFFETSLAMYLAPDTVGPVRAKLPPCQEVVPDARAARASRMAHRAGRTTLARELDLAAFGLGWMRLRPFPGYTSWPSAATPQTGEAFATEILARYRAVAADVLAGRTAAPRPIMEWLLSASLGGRLAITPRLGAADVLTPS